MVTSKEVYDIAIWILTALASLYILWLLPIALVGIKTMRNLGSEAVQTTKPVEVVDSPFGPMNVYEWNSPEWLYRLYPSLFRGEIVSKNDGFILMHGDRLQPAAIVLDVRLRKNPILRAREIQHKLGHTKIAVEYAGKKDQVTRNIAYDWIDSLKTTLLAYRTRSR
jgi:hypothetical protein